MKLFIPALILLAAAVAVAADKTDPKPDIQPAVNGDTQFALDLYAQLRSQDGNLFFSPYSISTALAMTRAGAKGETAAQMDKALHFDLPQDKLNSAFAGLIKEINGDPADQKRGYQLSTANALWGQKKYSFKADFLKVAKDDYGAELTDLDFGASEEARKTINDWVAKQTNDKIKDLIPPGVLDVDTRLVLTNAIYFKGEWASQFKKEGTHNGAFHLTADKAVDASLMRQKGPLRLPRRRRVPGRWKCRTRAATCRWWCCCRTRWTASPTWRRTSRPTSWPAGSARCTSSRSMSRCRNSRRRSNWG